MDSGKLFNSSSNSIEFIDFQHPASQPPASQPTIQRTIERPLGTIVVKSGPKETLFPAGIDWGAYWIYTANAEQMIGNSFR